MSLEDEGFELLRACLAIKARADTLMPVFAARAPKRTLAVESVLLLHSVAENDQLNMRQHQRQALPPDIATSSAAVHFNRLIDEGFIEEHHASKEATNRRYFRITTSGENYLADAMKQMPRLLKLDACATLRRTKPKKKEVENALCAF